MLLLSTCLCWTLRIFVSSQVFCWASVNHIYFIKNWYWVRYTISYIWLINPLLYSIYVVALFQLWNVWYAMEKPTDSIVDIFTIQSNLLNIWLNNELDFCVYVHHWNCNLCMDWFWWQIRTWVMIIWLQDWKKLFEMTSLNLMQINYGSTQYTVLIWTDFSFIQLSLCLVLV